MNKQETAKVLEQIACYYTDRRNIDPEKMVNAWHDILSRYDFKEVMRAVIDFAINDFREFPVFPIPAQIIHGMETIDIRDRKTLNGVILGLMYEKDFEGLEPPEKRYIRKDDYNRIMENWKYIEMVEKRDELVKLLKKLHEEATE